MRKIVVLLNARAGTMIDRGAKSVAGEITGQLCKIADDVDVRLLKPREMGNAIKRAASDDHDAVIIGGGDGSVSMAAAALAGTGKTLGVLPFGTLNLLARDLQIPFEIDAAIETLTRARPQQIDLASVNGRPFHTLSGIGFFSQMARAREETRGHKFGRLWSVGLAGLRAFRRSGRFSLTMEIDGKTENVEAGAVLVTNNQFDESWNRAHLDAGLIEIHIAEHASTLQRLKAGADLITGGWRANPGIRSVTARAITIDYARKRTWAATDGELKRERSPLRYAIIPKALTVLSGRGLN